jgi:hypothetical protein
MNLRPAGTHEPVTILMVPLDRYAVFPKAVDNIFKETDHPFKLIIVEGHSPESVRHQLEDRKKKHKNLQILYTAHAPRMAEAFNLGLVHVRTRHALLMHNQLSVTPGWLSNLVEHAKTRRGVLCPYVNHGEEAPFSFVHALLATKELLEEIGLFDESVATLFWGLELEKRLKAKGVAMHREPSTVLEYRPWTPLKSTDLRLFQHQWDDPHAHQTLAYLKQKWGACPEETRYLEWLSKKRSLEHRKRAFALGALALASAFPMADPLMGLKKLVQVLHRA